MPSAERLHCELDPKNMMYGISSCPITCMEEEGQFIIMIGSRVVSRQTVDGVEIYGSSFSVHIWGGDFLTKMVSASEYHT